MNEAYLKNKTVLITGAGGGIGRATAALLAASGARVAVNDLSKEKAEDAAAEIGIRAIAVPADVSKADEARKMAEEIKEKFGPVDILINNATAPIDFKRFEDLGWEEFEKHFEVQVRGAYNVIKAVLPDMKERGRGDIINIITGAVGGAAPARFSGYIAAKSGLLGLSRALAAELKNCGIRVNAVSPHMTNTDLTKKLPDVYKNISAEKSPSGKVAQPEDVAKEILKFILEIENTDCSDKNYFC